MLHYTRLFNPNAWAEPRDPEVHAAMEKLAKENPPTKEWCDAVYEQAMKEREAEELMEKFK